MLTKTVFAFGIIYDIEIGQYGELYSRQDVKEFFADEIEFKSRLTVLKNDTSVINIKIYTGDLYMIEEVRQ